MRTRPAAVAGQFYPASPTELTQQIEQFLATAAGQLADGTPVPKAIIAPHAGTIYSGAVAATAYARLRSASGRLQRVVLIGPSHRVWFEGVATSSAEAFTTPLGDIPLDRAMLADLLGLDGVVENDEAHRQEHSLEVHLPFLQSALGPFELVPLVVGRASAELVASVLEMAWGGEETAIVVSSDLSHFHDYETAARIDRETSSMIESLSLEALDGERACGYQPIRGLLYLARKLALPVELIDLRNSGDTAGRREEVVGYGSYVIG